MANPTGRTFHYGEHNPLSESSGIRFTTKEGPSRAPQPAPQGGEATVWDALRVKAEEWTSSLAPMTRDLWNSLEQCAARNPLLTLATGLGVGFLAGQCLTHGRHT